MFNISRIIPLAAKRNDVYPLQKRLFRTTAVTKSEAPSTTAIEGGISRELRKLAARDYNNRRAAYNRQVSRLRKEYAEKIAKQRAADKAEREALERELTRRRLERQRLKNIRSAQNAMHQKELREQRAREFQEHLRVQQEVRDKKKAMYRGAHQLVIDELEEEAPLWLTTREEVDKAFTHEAEQLLWARPGGVFGARNPSLDAHFWQFETHTWHMNKTYKSRRQILVEELVEKAYNEANIDDKFWSNGRLEEQIELETRARLRAMVHSAGRSELLRRQREMLAESEAILPGDAPKPLQAPGLHVLNNNKALEKEGVKLLMEDPTKFFVFEGGSLTDRNSDDFSSSDGEGGYDGPALGAPVALRDYLREGSYQNTVFPVSVGMLAKPDMRSERVKKQEEREARMMAAAKSEAVGGMDVDLAAEEQLEEDLGPPLNYDDCQWDSDDEEWSKGLDPEKDADLLNLPRERRYTQSDIDWAAEKIENKVKHLEEQLGVELENIKNEVRAELRSTSSSPDGSDSALPKDNSLDEAVLSLTDKEMMALSDLDDMYVEGISEEDLLSAMQDVPSLSREQIMAILTRDRTE